MSDLLAFAHFPLRLIPRYLRNSGVSTVSLGVPRSGDRREPAYIRQFLFRSLQFFSALHRPRHPPSPDVLVGDLRHVTSLLSLSVLFALGLVAIDFSRTRADNFSTDYPSCTTKSCGDWIFPLVQNKSLFPAHRETETHLLTQVHSHYLLIIDVSFIFSISLSVIHFIISF